MAPSRPCLIPVSYHAARRWLSGGATDADLLIRGQLTLEAVFAVNLPPRGLRESIERVLWYRQQGCRLLFGRTCNWRWLGMLVKRGAMTTFIEPCGDHRYCAPPVALDAWLAGLSDKFTR